MYSKLKKLTLGEVFDETMSRDDFVKAIGDGLTAIGTFIDGNKNTGSDELIRYGVQQLSFLLNTAMEAKYE